MRWERTIFFLRLWMSGAGLALVVPVHAQDKAAPAAPATPLTFEQALMGGQPHLEFRYRLETVDQQPFEDDAIASTLRSRLNYRTGTWHGFSGFVEADNVTVLGSDEAYNSTTNGISDRPIIADPEGTEVNQAWVRYETPSMAAILGRQRITLDNQRFIGNVGWRQNEQTYDAVTVQSRALARAQLQYSYLANVNRVTGPDEGAQPANYGSESHVLNARYDAGEPGAFTGFAYLLDLRNAPQLSSQTLGLQWAGTHEFAAARKATWTVSYARQTDYADNPNDYSADYYLLEAAFSGRNYALRAGFESLGGDADRANHAFQTPLATLHIFQGWADKFLTTPGAGVEDLYLSGTANLAGVSLQVIWHDFSAEATSVDYGSEWDASLSRKFGKGQRYEALLKLADYAADEFATDTTKLWLQLSATF